MQVVVFFVVFHPLCAHV